MSQDEGARKTKIRKLNDAFRKTFLGGCVLITPGMQALSEEVRESLLTEVRLFDNFNEKNDTYGEHDFGAIEHGNYKVFWKIDYYNKNNPNYGSEDASDPGQTDRVMTVMLSHEY